MNRQVVGRASRLPLERVATQLFAGETPAKTAGTAAPVHTGQGSWFQCAPHMAWRLSMNPTPPGPLPGGELALVRSPIVPLLGGVGGGFSGAKRVENSGSSLPDHRYAGREN